MKFKLLQIVSTKLLWNQGHNKEIQWEWSSIITLSARRKEEKYEKKKSVLRTLLYGLCNNESLSKKLSKPKKVIVCTAHASR